MPKYITTKFTDNELKEYIQNYYDRRHLGSVDDRSSMFSSTMYSHGRNACFSVDRETRDNRYLENYEKNKRRWQQYANILSKKVGKESPEQTLINLSEFYTEDMQKKSDFDEIQDKNMQNKLHYWYGNLRLSPLDGKLNRNFVPLGKTGTIGASETIHNKSKLLMKKPKELFLFSDKPRRTSILDAFKNRKRSL